MEYVEVVIIGAGVVGIAIARELSLMGREVILIEKASSFGQETSSRNSEVIHAGIYYPKDSLKAQLCVEGRGLLYHYCQERNIEHKKCGKLIVATSKSEIEKLEIIKKRAELNGVSNLKFLSKDEILDLEPELEVKAAVLSPNTGIVNSHEFMLHMLGDFENNSGIFVANSTIVAGEIAEDGIVLEIANSNNLSDRYKIKAKTVVNSAGLFSAKLLSNFKNFSEEFIPKLYFAKGNYFALSTKSPFKHLIYPVPEDGGLGVHLTLDIAGRAKFGPNVEWLRDDIIEKGGIDYKVDEDLIDSFYQNIKKYWPNIKKENLSPDYSGIRVKTAPKGQESDFVIQTKKSHGIDGLVNLFGIESPGLTSSLAIANLVASEL